METRKHPTRLLTAIIMTSALVMTLLIIPGTATAGPTQVGARFSGNETQHPVPVTERIDERDFGCGVRCSINLCISDAQTSPYHWCSLWAMGDGCDGGYDPSFCSGESGF